MSRENRIREEILKNIPNVGFSVFVGISSGAPKVDIYIPNPDLIFPTPIVEDGELLSAQALLELPPSYNPKQTIVRYSEKLQQNIVTRALPAWTDRNWFPEFEETARAKELPRLHDDWWILHMHDLLNWQIFGQASFTLDWGRRENKRIVDTYGSDPVQVHAAGRCPELAIAQAVELDPGKGKWFNGEWYDRPYLVGFLVAKHIGDRLVKLPLTAAALSSAIEQGQPVVVNAPEEPGDWWRALNGVSEDGKWVTVTNFGYPDKDVPFSLLTSAYVPVPDDSVTLNPAVTFRFRGNGRIPGLNRQLIDMIESQ